MLILSPNHSDPFNPTNIISQAPHEGNLHQLYIFNVTEPLMCRLIDVELIADEYSRVWDAQDDFLTIICE